MNHIERRFTGGPFRGLSATFPEDCRWVPYPPLASEYTGSYVRGPKSDVFRWRPGITTPLSDRGAPSE